MNKKLRYMMLCLSLFAFGCNDWMYNPNRK